MSARSKKTFKPTLEALEDRFLPSSTPLTTLAQPILNAKAAEAAVGRILSDVQQQLNAHQGMSSDLGRVVQQTNTAGPFASAASMAQWESLNAGNQAAAQAQPGSQTVTRNGVTI